MTHLEESFISRLIRINSRDRQNPSTPAEDFTYSMLEGADYLDQVKAVQVVHVSIPNTTPNVREGYLFTLDFTTGSGQQTAQIPKGFYESPAVLVEALAAAMGISIILNIEPSGKLSLTFTETVQLVTSPTLNYISYLLGFGNSPQSEGVVYNTDAGFKLVAPFTPRMQNTNTIYVHSAKMALGATNSIRGINPYLVTPVPMNTPFGEVTHFQPGDPLSQVHDYTLWESNDGGKSRAFHNIDLSLRDELGFVVDLQGQEWSITFKIFYNNH